MLSKIALASLVLANLQPILANPIAKPEAQRACVTKCIDKVNSCGRKYGGCFAPVSCGGTGDLWTVPPPCPSSTTKAVVSTSVETIVYSTSVKTITSLQTITTILPTPTTTTYITGGCQSTCIDKINSCGMTYGGCFQAKTCGGTGDVWTVPPACPISTTVITGPPISYTSQPVSPCYSICADKINSCGMTYGGCFMEKSCGGTGDIWTVPPPCPSNNPTSIQIITTTTPDVSNPITTINIPITTVTGDKPCGRICIDKINSCGMTYGGCYYEKFCGGSGDTWTVPPVCPVSTTVKLITTSNKPITTTGKPFSTSVITKTAVTLITISKSLTLRDPTSTVKATKINTTSVIKVTSIAGPLPSTTTKAGCVPQAGQLVCVDYVNECGMMYGGCGEVACDGSFPKAAKPPCPPGATTTWWN